MMIFFMAGYFETRIYLGKAGGPTINNYIRLGFAVNNLISLDYNNDQHMDLAAKVQELYLFKGSENGLQGISSCGSTAANPALSVAGKNVTKAGDINKDGFDDYIVGDPFVNSYEDDYHNEYNRVSVLLGNATGGSFDMQFDAVDEYLGEQQFGADINGDGYNDVLAGAEQHNSTRGRLIVFFGTPQGLTNIPDQQFVGNPGEYFGYRIENYGDINKDGFDDIGVASISDFYLLKGTPNGIDLNEKFTVPGLAYALAIGDINGDGYFDILATINNVRKVFFGSPTGPVESSITIASNLQIKRMDDLNQDGKADLIFYNPSNLTSTLYYSTGTEFISSGWSVTGNKIPVRAGDFNGDGFQDIMRESNLDAEIIEGANTRIDLFFGSAEGFPLTPSQFLRNEEDLLNPAELGDINNDGSSDIGAHNGNEIVIFFGTKGLGTLICPENVTLYADTSCTAMISNIDPPGNANQYRFEITGSTNINGEGSASGRVLNKGINFIRYYDKSNEQNNCSFIVTVRDSILPKLKGSEETFCNVNLNNVQVKKLEVIDCGKVTIEFQVHSPGVNFRTGTGNDASGAFTKGKNTILWTVVDSSGNRSTAMSIVNILSGDLNVKIPKAYQINAQQSQANTIYLGYANNTLRLTAYEPNSSKHKYLWSNGDTTRFTKITHNVPGTYEYSVIVTNDNGCSDTAYTTIKVVDNYCPNPIKSFITQYFPQLLNQPWIQALIASTSQMYLCYNGSTVCVNPAQVPAMISNGARLGKCGVIYENNDMITAKEETNSIGALTLTASPNPSSYEFTLMIDGTKGKPYALRIINSVGSPVFMKQGITENIVRAGSSFQKRSILC